MVALAALRGVPTLLMEQNATPGLTNRLLARVVRAAAVTYDESLETFGAKAFVAGNPVRPEFFAGARDDRGGGRADAGAGVRRFAGRARDQRRHGRGGGARWPRPAPGVHVTHQTGERDLDMVREAYAAAGLEARVEPFLFEMHREMRAADVVVCRAGATTLAELTAAGRAAILIPLPTATDDHQRRNAEALARQGAARVIEQRDLTPATAGRGDARAGRRRRGARAHGGRGASGWRGRTRRA